MVPSWSLRLLVCGWVKNQKEHSRKEVEANILIFYLQAMHINHRFCPMTCSLLICAATVLGRCRAHAEGWRERQRLTNGIAHWQTRHDDIRTTAR